MIPWIRQKHQPKIGMDSPVAHPRHHCTRSSPRYQPGGGITAEHTAPTQGETAGDDARTLAQTTVPAASAACFS